VAHAGTLLGAVLLLACLFAVSLASAQDDPAYGLLADNNVDVYVGPDFAYAVVDSLPIDASVVVIGRAGDYYGGYSGRTWLQIEYGDGYSGWVLGRTVRMGRAFNTIDVTGVRLPRDRNYRVPEVFNLFSNICDTWQGSFSQSGDFMAGDQRMTVSYPGMPGAVNYPVLVHTPSGLRRTFDSSDTTQVIPLGGLNYEPGTYTWLFPTGTIRPIPTAPRRRNCYRRCAPGRFSG
jgi:uncharacterized protein YraI